MPIEHWVQPSGAQVWLVQSPAIPMLDVQLDFDAGERRDPPGQSGLANAAATMTSKGVAPQGPLPALDENQLGQAWADLGASFGCGASSDRLSCKLRTLTDPALLPQSVQLASRQLGTPSFAPAVWQRERARWSASIQESLTRPATVAARAFERAVYGSHPYGAHPTPQSLARIDAAALRRFYGQHVQACRAKVSVVGAVTREQADRIVTELLSRLPASGPCAALPAVAEVPALAAPVTERIAMPTAQSHVLIGQPGYKRSDPDFFALLVGNHILGGGGFTSRLMQQVREQRGLSYSVYSHFQPGLHAGAFTIGLQTKPDQAAQAVQVAQQVLADFVREGPSADELQAAKDNLIGGFALRLDGNAKLLGNVANIAWNGLPLDYLDTWTRHVEQVSAADVRRAFARVLQPERMVTVIVGGPASQP